MTTAFRQLFAVPSAGRVLRVDATERLASWWPRFVPYLPGVPTAELLPVSGDGIADLVISEDAGIGDVRRLINAHLQLLHMRRGTLCLHAAAMSRADSAVLLLGGHGAGKSLVSLALVDHGWQFMAGDITLVDVPGLAQVTTIRGGTSAFLVRPGPTRRWFPELELLAAGQGKVDLLGRRASPVQVMERKPTPVTGAMVVDVDGDPQCGTGVVEELDRQTAATIWWRASGHLVDRVLEDGDAVLRELENSETLRLRRDSVRSLASAVPIRRAWGSPRAIAAHVDRFVALTEERQRIRR